MSEQDLPSRSEEAQKPEEYAIHPSLGVPKKVAWALGAGLLGIVVGGAIVGFTAAVAAPAIRDRLRKRQERREPVQPPSEAA